MIKKLYMPLLVAMVAVLTSCSSKMGELSADYFTTNPQVLEAVGGKVPVTINGKFPEKYFNKKAVVTVTPVLKWEGGQAVGTPATFQGEKVEGNDQTIYYKAGGAYTMKTTFDYVPAMAKSELYLQFSAKVGKKEVAIPEVKVADGVLATGEIMSTNANYTLGATEPSMSSDKFQRIIKEAKEANIMFLIQQANVRANQLKTAEMNALNEQMAAIKADDKNLALTNVEVTAYASPDGELGLNEKLAGNRESNAAAYAKKQLKKAKLEGNIDTKYTAEDWEGFKTLVEKSNIQDKEVILRVLSMYNDPERREAEIKNLSSVYGTLADEILPQLRRARLTLNYEIIGRSDDEILNTFAASPKELSVEELLYAATLVKGSSDKEAIYKKTTEIYPKDYRAFNNLANLAYQDGDMEAAASYLAKAAGINAAAPEVNNNLGLMAMLNGEKEKAEAYLAKSSGAEKLNEALGNLYIAQGQYDRAVSSFKEAKTNSAALAQIMSKDYNKAKSTLEAVTNPDAYTSYLKAVVGARTNNASMVVSNLAKAVKEDASLAQKAMKDAEFAKYLTNADFLNALK
ncbi:MAG: tetratricopeptide repeat protein [Bacteroidaceae bacterium]|nr:tetratricopeptide repeat protein [Bacteroidaceae bacterium]